MRALVSSLWSLVVLTACSFRGPSAVGGDARDLDGHPDTLVVDAAMTDVPAGCGTGPCFRKAIVVPPSSVSGTAITVFDLLVHVTDPDLMAHARTDAADIFFTDAATGAKLDFERQKWVPQTGELVVWVRLLALPPAGTMIYLNYGNPNHTTDLQNADATWGTTYMGVWHLEETAGTTLADSSGAGNTGNARTGLVLGMPGQIGNALTFNSVMAQMQVPQSATLQTLNSTATFTMWIKWTQPIATGYQNIMSTSNRYAGAGDGFEWDVQPSGFDGYYFYPNGGASDYNLVDPSPFLANTWQYAAVVIDFTAMPKTIGLFVDGVAITPTTKHVGNWTQLATLADFLFGFDPNAPDLRGFAGQMDEIRLSTAIRSVGFLRTEWANQRDPGSFYTVGSQETL